MRPSKRRAVEISHTGVDLRGIVVDDDTPWRDDYSARALVALHPHGMTLTEIGAVLRGSSHNARTGGMSHEMVRQIIASAERKLRRSPEAEEAWREANARRTRAAPTMAPEDYAPDDGGEWPSYADSRQLQRRGRRGSWGYHGQALPPGATVRDGSAGSRPASLEKRQSPAAE